jgi:hypothetical protein
MFRVPVLAVLLCLVAGPAAAQSTMYGGGTVAVDAGSRGAFDTLGTSFPAAGGFIGWHFNDAWSMEVHVDRGFAESPERERLEIFGHSTVRDRAGPGLSVLAAWKMRHRSRVGAAVTMGLSMRMLCTDRVSITKDDPNDPYPVSLGPAYRDAGAGLGGGAFFPIALGRRWSLAPEVRVTLGVTAEAGGYAQVSSGVRAMWGF